MKSGLTETDVRALTFSTLIVTNLALIAANRSLTQPVWVSQGANPALRWLAIGALAVLAAILYVPVFRDFFRLAMPHAIQLHRILGVRGDPPNSLAQ